LRAGGPVSPHGRRLCLPGRNLRPQSRLSLRLDADLHLRAGDDRRAGRLFQLRFLPPVRNPGPLPSRHRPGRDGVCSVCQQRRRQAGGLPAGARDILQADPHRSACRFRPLERKRPCAEPLDRGRRIRDLLRRRHCHPLCLRRLGAGGFRGGGNEESRQNPAAGRRRRSDLSVRRVHRHQRRPSQGFIAFRDGRPGP